MDNSFQITEYPLHEAVFSGNLKELSQLLKANKNLIDEKVRFPTEKSYRTCVLLDFFLLFVLLKDFHGNTPLHLATMMGRFDCVCLLLSHNATVNIKNGTGWSVLAEAISFGNRPMIELLLKKLKKQSREQMKKRRPQLIAALTTVNDFYLELRWEFSSWIPLVSKILPGDVCKIYKLGSSIRLDSTLIDFNDMHWQRGDISFIFRGDKENDESIVVMDNESKVFQVVRTQESDAEMQDEIDLLMQSDILTASMSTKSITFQKAQAGWFFREDKKETIAGQYKCEIFNINGLVLEQRKRREHLNLDDLQKNKTSIVESLTKSSQAVETSNTEVMPNNINVADTILHYQFTFQNENNKQ